jgi:hypothetical protein
MCRGDAKLQRLPSQILGDLSGAASVAAVRMGHALGLCRAMQTSGAMPYVNLVPEAKVNERYLCEWLTYQAASDCHSYDPASGRLDLPLEKRSGWRAAETQFIMILQACRWALRAARSSEPMTQRSWPYAPGLRRRSPPPNGPPRAMS